MTTTTAWKIWAAPAALAVVSLIGLVAGLLGDGPWDWISWAGLGLPVAVCLVRGLPPRRPPRPRQRRGSTRFLQSDR